MQKQLSRIYLKYYIFPLLPNANAKEKKNHMSGRINTGSFIIRYIDSLLMKWQT